MDPLICISFTVTFLLFLSVVGIIQEVLSNGVLVWHRDNLGLMISQMIFHFALLRTLFMLKRYIISKEKRLWQVDKNNDGHMDFYEAFRPMFIFICLYMFKLSCLRTDYTEIKMITCFAFLYLTNIGESHFDRNLYNDYPIWMLAVPISLILTCQAVHDIKLFY